jgi:DNA-binding transcriptional ArsR family regulator
VKNVPPQHAASRGADDSAVASVFAALSDPTRRHVLGVLSRRTSITASALAEELPISRQAVAKHLGALADAGLVRSRHEGRETRYRLTPEPLGVAMRWLASTGAEWDERLAKLSRRLSERPEHRPR